jgi:hypothetical protein
VWDVLVLDTCTHISVHSSLLQGHYEAQGRKFHHAASFGILCRHELFRFL